MRPRGKTPSILLQYINANNHANIPAALLPNKDFGYKVDKGIGKLSDAERNTIPAGNPIPHRRNSL
jgi:hypothetical protein